MYYPDVRFKEIWLWSVIIVVLILVIMKKLTSPMIKLIMRPVFAFIMFIFTKLYNRMLGPKKRELFESMQKHLEKVEGDVLEIGAGTGANFAFYPRGCSIVALDPNPHMNFYLLHAEKFYPNVTLKEYITGTAENMKKIENQSVSTVVSTLVLCSVESVEQVLKEIIRILKPGGRFYFMEHVKGKGFTLILQKWNQPWWFYLSDGCRLMRDLESSIRQAGFKSVKCEAFNALNVGPFIKPHIMGFAEV